MASSVGGNGGIIGASNVPTSANPNAQVTDITSSGCFNRTGTTATVIVVGGGGGGAQAGGGAGGVLVTECHPLPSNAVPVTIGAGGAGRPDPAPYADPGTSGSASVFGSATPLTANGGGGGGGNFGNGGGGGNETAAPNSPSTAPRSVFGTAGQGFNGGSGGGFQQAGGGGGAGMAGASVSVYGGHGGAGRNLQPYGVPKCIGDCGVLGGGGGGTLAQFGDGLPADANCSAGPVFQIHAAPFSPAEQYAAGGIGGGGQGGVKRAISCGGIFFAPTNGTANTGGGGGGDNAGYANGPGIAGTGGSGRVIVVEPGVAAGTVGDGVYSMQAQFNAKAASRWK